MANKFASPLALRYVEVPLYSGWLSFVRALTTHDERRVRGRKV